MAYYYLIPIPSLNWGRLKFYTLVEDREDAIPLYAQFIQKVDKSITESRNDYLNIINSIYKSSYYQDTSLFDSARPERKAWALPPIRTKGSTRLYFCRVVESTFVLLSGGQKEERTAQKSKGVSMWFYFANRVADQLEQSLFEDLLETGMQL